MAATADAQRHAAQVARRLSQTVSRRHLLAQFPVAVELLVATILSAQCTDQRVNQVTKDLFQKYPTAAHYARARLPELERDIQSTGFFRNKAKSIQNCCRILLERYNGRSAPGYRSTGGVAGRRAARRPTWCWAPPTALPPAWWSIRTSRRISRRLGLTRPKGPREDREGPDGAVSREGVDRVEPSHDPSRPPLLHRPQTQVRRVPVGSDLPANGVEGRASQLVFDRFRHS